MLDHISEDALKKYREKSLSPAEVLAVCDHLESCLKCREKVVGTTPLDDLFTAFDTELQATGDDSTPHLLPEELADYVDGELDEADREIAESHLLFCHPCRDEVQDLRAFKASLNLFSVKEYPAKKPLGFWQKTLLLWRASAWGMTIQAATLAIVIFFFITTLLLKRQVANVNNALSELQQKNEELQQQLEEIPELQSQIALLQLTQNPLPEASSKTTESLNDHGKQIAIVQGGLTGIEALAPEIEQLVKSALVNQRVRQSAVPKELLAKGEVLMSGNDKKNFFPLIRPRSKIIETDRPTLDWGALNGATEYVVTVYDANANPVAKSSPLATTHWTLPKALKRGVIYSWEVIAKKGNEEIMAPAPPVPPAKFKVLEQTKYEALSRAKQAYNSHLVAGVLYAQAGLFDEAEHEFKSLVAANPNSKLAKQLLRSLERPKAPKR